MNFEKDLANKIKALNLLVNNYRLTQLTIAAHNCHI